MTTAERTRCTKCNKLKNSIKCAGCAQDFCLDDMVAHRQELSEQLGYTEDRFNQFTHEIERETTKPHEHPMMELIDRWEQRSTAKIQQMANQVRRELSIRLMSFTADLQLRLKQLSESLVKCRQENDFVDTDIHYYNEQLKLLRSSLSTPPTLRLQHTLTSFIDRIHLMSDGKSTPTGEKKLSNLTARASILLQYPCHRVQTVHGLLSLRLVGMGKVLN